MFTEMFHVGLNVDKGDIFLLLLTCIVHVYQDEGCEVHAVLLCQDVVSYCGKVIL